MQKRVKGYERPDNPSSRKEVRDKGIKYVVSRLRKHLWCVLTCKKERSEVHCIKRKNAKHVVKIRALSKVAPVPFPQGFKELECIDYLIICNNLKGTPNVIVIKSDIIEKISHKDTKNKNSYWLQPKAYEKHDLGFDNVFG